MKKLKLTPLQQFRLHEALRHSSEVLREIKMNTLSGPALDLMKMLEDAVGNISTINMLADR